MRPPRDPYYPWRKYADPEPNGKGWTYTDTSKFYKNKIRFSFTRGQQLWDDDWNNNMDWWGLWLGMWAQYRRNVHDNQMPPYYSPNSRRTVYDPKHSNPPGGHVDFIRYVNLLSGISYWYQPMLGSKAWVDADRMYICYTRAGWKPVARLRDKQWDMEIAIFAAGGKAGEIVARKTISQPFRIEKKYNACRGKFFSQGEPYQILRNGVVVATINQGEYVAKVSFTPEFLDFQTGDVLALRANSTRAKSYVSLTLLGTRL